jgi:hypothetical protein
MHDSLDFVSEQHAACDVKRLFDLVSEQQAEHIQNFMLAAYTYLIL